MVLFLRYYLPTFLVVYFLVTFVLPSVRVYKKTGVNPVTFGSKSTTHDYIGKVMKFITGLLLLAVCFFALSVEAYQYLVPVTYLEGNSIRITGIVLIHLSLIWIIIAQKQMSMSWRIGLDENIKTQLVTHGLFRWSRNPVFLGMIISTFGIFLIIPNAVTFFVACTSYIIIQIQIRIEEQHLLNQHGQQYEQYKKRFEDFFDKRFA
jgi:protein-S-isoprenylcysteine O-methyltransferase Ste14